MTNSTENVGAHNLDDVDVAVILRRIRSCVENISLGFGRWDDGHVRGPGLYFVVTDFGAEFSEPMGANRWPVEECESILDDLHTVEETARNVASTRDGAVVVHRDGTIEERMVRLRQLSGAESARIGDLPYAGWMGARHMSALETSTRKEVTSAITLSEEDGRMTVFTDGSFEDFHRDVLGKGTGIDDREPTASPGSDYL